MPGQIAYGTFLGGGDAIRRGIGGVGDMLREYGAIEMQQAQNAEQRAWQQSQAEENRRRWEAQMRLDRQREQRLQAQHDARMAAAGPDAIADAESPASVDAAVSAYGPYTSGYREGVEPFEVAAPTVPGMGEMTASMAPGAPAWNPLARAGRERIAQLESAPDEPLYNVRGVSLPLDAALDVTRRFGAAGRAPQGAGGGSATFRVGGRTFEDTPAGHAAAVEWRERLYGREDAFGLDGGGVLSGPESEEPPSRRITPEGKLIVGTAPDSDTGRLRGPDAGERWELPSGDLIPSDSVEATVREALQAGASEADIIAFMVEQGEPEADVREILRRASR